MASEGNLKAGVLHELSMEDHDFYLSMLPRRIREFMIFHAEVAFDAREAYDMMKLWFMSESEVLSGLKKASDHEYRNAYRGIRPDKTALTSYSASARVGGWGARLP